MPGEAGIPPVLAVVDSCVFPHRDWMARIREGARGGSLIPIWSPLILVEVTRLLTWRWLAQNRGDQSSASRRQCSAEIKQWFADATEVFRVVDDRPPHEETWDSPRDAWDVPIWNAARRSDAHVIVTENLRDGPPEDAAGRRIFQGVLWCHPTIFLRVLDRWSDGESDLDTSTPGDPDRAGIAGRILAVYDEVRR